MTAHWKVSMNKTNFSKIAIGAIIVIALIYGYRNKTENEKIQLIKEDTLDQVDKTDLETAIADEEEPIVETIYVHISGQVNKPGLYELDTKSRLNDLVKKAGGLTDSADLMTINLSLILNDQDRIHIYEIGEQINNLNESVINLNSHSNASDGKVKINTASLEELMSLPGIGEKRAQDIIELRSKEKINSLEDLGQVKGLGPKSLENLESLVNFD